MLEAVAHPRHHDALKAAEALLDRWLPSKPPRVPLRNPFDVLEDDVAKVLLECLVGPVRLPVSERNLYGPAPRFQVVNDRAGALFVEVVLEAPSRRTHYPRGQVTLDGRMMLNTDNFAICITRPSPDEPPLAHVTMDLYLSNDQTERGAEIRAISAVLDRRCMVIGYRNGEIAVELKGAAHEATLRDKLGDPASLFLSAYGRVTYTRGM